MDKPEPCAILKFLKFRHEQMNALAKKEIELCDAIRAMIPENLKLWSIVDGDDVVRRLFDADWHDDVAYIYSSRESTQESCGFSDLDEFKTRLDILAIAWQGIIEVSFDDELIPGRPKICVVFKAL